MYGISSTILKLTSSALAISRWTAVSIDEKLLNHLILFLWTWDTLVNRVTDRALFEDALKHMDPSDQEGPRFCSPFLARDLYQRVLNLKYSLPERLRAEDALHPATILMQ
jgi:hypothetical protein